METLSQKRIYPFLQGGGEMGELTRNFDWSRTIIGRPEDWPSSLRTTVSNLLRSRFPMFLWWGESLIQFYNDAYRPSMGNEGKHPKALGQNGRECWPEIWDIIYPLIKQVQTSGEPTWNEDQLVPIFRNGAIEDVYWTYSYSAVLDDAGKPAGVLVTCTETTEKVTSFKQLAESNAQLGFAIEAAELGTWDFNPSTNKFTGNDRLKEWFGLPPHAEIELPMALAVIPEKDRKRVINSIQYSLQYSSGGFYDIEYAIVNPITNKERIVSAKGRAWFNEEKIAYRFNGTLQDVTTQTIAHKIIEESERNLRNMILQAPVAICILKSSEYIVEIANDRMFELWGKPAEELMNKPIFIGLPEAKEQGLEDLLNKVYTTGKTFKAFERPVDLPRGSKIWTTYLNFVYEPLYEAGGAISGIMVMAVEVTEQVLARQKIEEVVAQRTKELAEANNALQQNNRELEQFAYVASHDMQEPLRKVSTFTQMLERSLNPIDERSKIYLAKIAFSTDRLMQLIGDVLNFSKLSHDQELFVSVDLNTVLENIISDFELLIEQKSAAIHFSNMPILEAIPLQMQQLFSNLISNALKFSRSDGPPVVMINTNRVSDKEKREHKELLADADYFLITVEDNGIGFEQEYARKIFDIFQRLHGKTAYAGTGIGLALCKKIAQNHQGKIWATSGKTTGAIFYIMLPEKLVINKGVFKV